MRMQLKRCFCHMNIALCMVALFIISSSAFGITNDFSEYEDVIFELSTREQPDSHARLNTSWGDQIYETNWKRDRPTRIFVHGFKSKRKILDRYRDGFLAAGDYNYITVNWMKGSSTFNYYVAKNRVKKVKILSYYYTLSTRDVFISMSQRSSRS